MRNIIRKWLGIDTYDTAESLRKEIAFQLSVNREFIQEVADKWHERINREVDIHYNWHIESLVDDVASKQLTTIVNSEEFLDKIITRIKNKQL